MYHTLIKKESFKEKYMYLSTSKADVDKKNRHFKIEKNIKMKKSAILYVIK